MELRISEDEVKEILLDWAAEKWPQMFNTVKVNASYGHMTSVELSKEEPEATDADKLKAA